MEFVVFQDALPEVLISGPVSQSLGSKFHAHLGAVRDQHHGSDFSEIGFMKSAPLLLSLLAHIQVNAAILEPLWFYGDCIDCNSIILQKKQKFGALNFICGEGVILE